MPSEYLLPLRLLKAGAHEIPADQDRTAHEHRVAREKLKLLAKQRKPVRLVCSLEIYPKMVITGIDYDRDSKSGSSIRFTMTLRELKTVSLKAMTGTYNFQPEELKTANDKMIASEKKAGKRTAEEISAEKAAAELKQIHDLEIQ